MSRTFLLSPAYAGGKRAQMIMSERAQFELARRLRSDDRPTLGEVFSFLSGLYFRGKLAYANVFAQPAPRISGVLVITPNSRRSSIPIGNAAGTNPRFGVMTRTPEILGAGCAKAFAYASFPRK